MTTQEILKAARAARPALYRAGTEQKNTALRAMAEALWEDRSAILAANRGDMEAARDHISPVMLDRLALSEERIAAMV